MIQWNDNLKTGISTIDEQHQKLFETANKLEECKHTEEFFYEVVIALNQYISEHFKTEEEYMRLTEYPEYESHKNCHDSFASDLKNIIQTHSVESSIMDSRIELISFVEDWLANHYKNEDVKMAAHLNKKSFKP